VSSVFDSRIARRTVLRTLLGSGVAASAGAGIGFWSAASAAQAATSSDQKKELAYVCNSLDDSVTVIDVATNRVVNTVRMDFGKKRTIPRWPSGEAFVANAPMNAAFTPDRKQVWVPNSKGRNVAVIDVTSNSVLKRIDLVMDPCEVAFTPDGQRAIVSLIGDTIYSQGAVTVIDVPSGKPSPPILIGTQPEELALTPDGARAYVVSKSLWVIDVAKGSIEREVYLPYRCYDAVVSPDGKHVYVSATFGAPKIVIVDNASDTKNIVVSGAIDVEVPCGMAFSPDRRLMYVTSNSANSVQIVDLQTKKVIKTGAVPKMPGVIALTAQGDRAYVAHAAGHDVTVIKTDTLEVVDSIRCGDQPNSVAIAVVS
jgi:YVTN family beta-propeller protein